MAARRWKATLEAHEDLREIALYTKENWGVAQKNAYLKSIKMIFDRLAENPMIGRRRSELGKGVFSIPVREHVGFYQYDAAWVYIARILHQRRDPKRAG